MLYMISITTLIYENINKYGKILPFIISIKRKILYDY